MSDPSAVLVVEDDQDLGDLVMFILQMKGFTTRLVRDGGTAMLELNQTLVTPGLVVLDMHLPGVSGMDIMHYIRHEPRYADTKVLVTTADLQLADRVQRVADYVCTKPFSVDELLTAVSGLVTPSTADPLAI